MWRVSDRWPPPGPKLSQGWRFVPLSASLVILVFTFATFGVGVILAPVAALLTFLAARRLAPPRGVAYRLGAIVTVLLGVGFVTGLGIFVYDAIWGDL